MYFRKSFRKSCFSGCVNHVSQIIKRFWCNIRFDCFYELFLAIWKWQLLNFSPKSHKYFSEHDLKAADLNPVLLVTSHPIKICVLSSTRDFSVPRISSNRWTDICLWRSWISNFIDFNNDIIVLGTWEDAKLYVTTSVSFDRTSNY